MPIKMRFGSAEVEADTAEEAAALLLAVGAIQKAGTNGAHPDPNRPIHEALRAIKGRLKSPQQESVLRLLADAEDGLTDAQLTGALGLANNSALAGLMGAISKYANKEGIEYGRAIRKLVRKNESGGREYLYRLTPEMRDIMKGESRR